MNERRARRTVTRREEGGRRPLTTAVFAPITGEPFPLCPAVSLSRESGMVGVGTVVAHRPLRRSGRAALPHPALVSGADAVPRTDSAYLSPRLVHITPALCPVCAELAQVPLAQAPSLRLFRGRTARVVQRLRRYSGPVRLPGAVQRRRASLDFPTRPSASSTPGGHGISRFP